MNENRREPSGRVVNEVKQYRVQHLLLLIGKNPLPNAIAGRLLVEGGGKITLIHSEEVSGVAQKIHNWLRDEGFDSNDIKFQQVEESDPKSVFDGVVKALNGFPNATSVGLNYTGGTKAMSVHSYRAVELWAGKRKMKPTFSYLDARSLEMVLGPFAPEEGEDAVKKYVGDFEMRRKQLLHLHDWKLLHPPTDKPKMPHVAEALAEVNAEKSALGVWVKWKMAELNKCRYSKNSWLNPNKLQNIKLNLPIEKELAEVTKALRAALGLSDTVTAFEVGNAARIFGYKFDNTEEFCEWLNGKWLEHYTLKLLLELADEGSYLHDCAQNVETREVQFDGDVVAIRGYQLFLFSCSTSQRRKELKLRILEAYTRGHQLGGDEARTALVCLWDDAEDLQKEMRHNVDLAGKVFVFGRKHLKKTGKGLKTHLKEWIEEQAERGSNQ